MKWTLIVLASLLVAGAVFFLVGCVNHVDINAEGIAYNSVGGKISYQERPGYYFTWPTVRVMYVHFLPQKVCVDSGARLVNCKLVRFLKEGIDDYVHLQGFDTDHDEESILRGYAYSGRKYSFLAILEEPDAALSEKK